MKRIKVYCGSNPGTRSEYTTAAEELGSLLARKKIELLYGGGRRGLMGKLADAALRNGGHVIGVIPEKLFTSEAVHNELTDLRVVKTMHERKALLAELADGFIVLPGGYGTFEELFEMMAWGQLGWHDKPLAFLNSVGFYDPLMVFLDHAAQEGFIRVRPREWIILEHRAEAVLDRMKRY
jgi:uncharacterized protein (TIGR00730 family)